MRLRRVAGRDGGRHGRGAAWVRREREREALSRTPRKPRARVGGPWFDVSMTAQDRIARDTHATWAAWIGFAVGAALGTALLWGPARPLAGEGSIGLPAAGVAALAAVTGFAAGSLLHRRGETAQMPRWQQIVSRVSDAAVALALAGVTALAVLCLGEVLAVGLDGLQVAPLGGGLLTGAAAAAASSAGFGLGARVRTDDLVGLLFSFLVTGTLFSMLTAADPRWWERNFSQLGAGGSAWAFNGTLVLGGLLLAAVGAYIGRDLHRILGDAALGRIAPVVLLFAATGVSLALIGLFPLHRAPVPHLVAAIATLVLMAASAVAVAVAMPGPPPALLVTTVGVGVGLVVAVLLWQPLHLYAATGLEAVAVGLAFVWLTTLMRALAALAPDEPRPSARPILRGALRR